MYITELSIKRPVVAVVFSMILVVFGLFVFSKLPVRELPSGLQPPVVQIQVDYQGASAEVISSEITEIIEDVIGGAEGIKNIDSTSENGRSTIKIEFETNIDLGSQRDKLSNKLVELEKKIISLDQKLINKNYLKKAPKNIVANDKVLLKDLTIELTKIKSIVSSIN